MYNKTDLEIRDNRIIVKIWDDDKINYYYQTLIEVQYGNYNERQAVLKLTLSALTK